MSNQLQVSGAAKIRSIQGPVVANSGVITALDGDASQYVRGDGTLADFPTSTGGGSSVSYYLNTSVSQGTIGGVAYKQLSKTPISGAGTDVTISANGYVASYITDSNDPALLEVPAGNFNCEFYFSVDSNAHNPYVYAELYKYDGTTFTLLGSSQSVPEYLTNGTTLSPYYFAIPVATAVLTVTDRIAIRIYVNVDTRTVTLHTENNHLCQVVTTFSKGLISLNNLTRQNQFFQTGTSGTDFAISSATATHTFNLPVASATNTGKLSSTDWSTFNNKQATISLTTTGTSGAATLIGATLNIPNYGSALSSYVPYTGATADVDLGSNSIISSFIYGNGVSGIAGAIYLKQTTSVQDASSVYSSISAFGGYSFHCSLNNGTLIRRFRLNAFYLDGTNIRTYTLPNADGTLALTSDLSGYLPLAGGTLTGALNGTSAVFSSTVQASAYRLTGMTGGSGALYWTSDRVTLANYNATGVVNIEANGGTSVATFGGATYNNDFVGTLRNTTSAYFATTSGNVGIGNTNTSYTLDVSGTGRYYSNSSSAGNATGVRIEQAGTGDAAISYLLSGVREWLVGVDNSDGDAFKINNITGSSDFNNVGLTITSAGNVGIGETPTSSIGWARILTLNGNNVGDTAYILKKTGSAQEIAFGTDGSNLYVDVAGAATATNNNIVFRTGATNSSYSLTERMRITSGGRIGINETNPQDLVHIANGTLRIDGTAAQAIYIRGAAGIKNYITINEFGVRQWDIAAGTYSVGTFSIQSNSINGVYLGGTATAWASASDENLKDIIEPIQNAVTKVNGLRSVIGKYKTDEEDVRRSFLIAQDIQTHFPEALESSNPDRLGVQYTDVIPLLVAAIKEQQIQIQNLQEQINILAK